MFVRAESPWVTVLGGAGTALDGPVWVQRGRRDVKQRPQPQQDPAETS